MNIFKDIYNFFVTLSFIDIVFLLAIVALLILVITLVYFIKINKDMVKDDPVIINNELKEEDNNIISVDNIEDKKEVISKYEEYDDEEGELLDLEALTEKLRNEKESDRMSVSEYEKDQEEKAIISYDELLEKKNKYAINYEKEEMIDDLLVKKVDLNDLTNKGNDEVITSDVRVISYQKEEDFLKALKELNSLLN